MLRISKTLLKTQPLYFPRLQGQATYARPLYTIAKQRQPGDISGGKNSAPQLKSHRAAFCSRASKHSFLSFQQSWSQSAVKILGTDVSENIVYVTWEDDNKNQYPLIYLRDICQCPSCVHPDFKHRISDVLATCGLDYSSTATNVSQDGKVLEIIWSDNHVSR